MGQVPELGSKLLPLLLSGVTVSRGNAERHQEHPEHIPLRERNGHTIGMEHHDVAQALSAQHGLGAAFAFAANANPSKYLHPEPRL